MLAGEIAKAVASFQAALMLSANDADIYGDLARAQAMQADWPRWNPISMPRWRSSPGGPIFWCCGPAPVTRQNRIADARADVEAALQMSPKNPDALVERGSIQRDSGDLKGARADFQAALALEAAGETADAARRNLAALDVARRSLPPNPPLKKK